MSDQALHGFLVICKPRGWSSHDVVARVRRLLGTRHVGHAGTLDPLAEGVLPLAINRATKLVNHLVEGDKAYFAVLRLGVTTDTLDAEGAVLEQRPLPALDPNTVTQVLAHFLGPQLQAPPAFSAVRVAGRRAYALARRGAAPELPPRPIIIRSLDLCWLAGDLLAIQVQCSKGTYVRALARDIGEALGCGASLARLVRTRVGALRLEDAAGLEELTAAVESGRLLELVIGIDRAFAAWPAVVLSSRAAARLRHGGAWRGPEAPPGTVARAYASDGSFLGLAATAGGGLWGPRLALEAA